MKNLRMMVVATAAMCVLLAMSVFTAGPTFRADYRFSGTALTDFKPVGSADWKVQNGEIVGTAKDANGGWLLLGGKEFQDTQMYASVKCVGGCKAGFVMRAEKTPDGGMKGVLMSVTENDLVPYIVKIDASGKEISREPLPAPAGAGRRRADWRRRRPAGGARGGAPPAPPTTPPRAWLPPQLPWADVLRIRVRRRRCPPSSRRSIRRSHDWPPVRRARSRRAITTRWRSY